MLKYGLKTTFVYRSLKEKILSGELQPGARLLLRELAREQGTSELPVREAIRMLERDGLVQSLPHRGARVTRLTLDEVEEAFLIRGHLEAIAIEQAVPHMTKAHLAEIDECMTAMDALLDTGDGVAFGEMNREFHQAIYKACPFKRLHALIENLWDGQTKLHAIFLLRPARMEAAQVEHRAIVAKIRQGDAAAAAALMLDHKLRASKVLVHALRELESALSKTG